MLFSGLPKASEGKEWGLSITYMHKCNTTEMKQMQTDLLHSIYYSILTSVEATLIFCGRLNEHREPFNYFRKSFSEVSSDTTAAAVKQAGKQAKQSWLTCHGWSNECKEQLNRSDRKLLVYSREGAQVLLLVLCLLTVVTSASV